MFAHRKPVFPIGGYSSIGGRFPKTIIPHRGLTIFQGYERYFNTQFFPDVSFHASLRQLLIFKFCAAQERHKINYQIINQ